MGRTIDILNAIKNGTSYTPESYSRAEAILKSIANNTEYESDAISRYEELLLSIKNSTTTSLVPQTRVEEILVAIANGTLDTYLAGKNLINPVWEYGSISATNGNRTSSTTKLRTANLIQVLHGKTYTIALNQLENKFGILNIHAYSKTGEWLGSRAYFELPTLGTRTTKLTFTVPSDVYSLGFVLTVYGDDAATINIDDLSFTNVVMVIGSTASTNNEYAFKSEIEEAFVEAFGGE